jgi:hypothetical protein
MMAEWLTLSYTVGVPSIIIALVCIAKLTIWLFRKGVKLARKSYGFWLKVHDLLCLAEQFKPNGGSSFYDKLNLLHRDVKIIGAKFNAMLNLTPNVAFFKTCEEGYYEFITPLWSEITGLGLEQAEGYGWINAVAEEDKDRVIKEWNNAISQEREFHMDYYIMNFKTNVKHKVHACTNVVRDDNGKPIKYLGTLKVVA